MPIITKSERVHLVATKREVEQWRIQADALGVSLSAWLRLAAESVVTRAAKHRTVRLRD